MVVSLVVTVFLVFCVVCGCVSASGGNLKLNQTKDVLHKPLKTIKTEDGDFIECMDIRSQPAFDHPLLKTHTIQLKPNKPKKNTILVDSPLESKLPTSRVMTAQMWQKSGSCPDGTVPIRRIQEGIEKYMIKISSTVLTHKSSDTLPLSSKQNHSSVMLATAGNYLGAEATMSVWNPSVEADDEYTTSQVWLMDDPNNISDSIEVGWMVNPSLYGDRQTRLFIFWKSDAGGCFDINCSGFVQTSQTVVLGMPIKPISRDQGEQCETSVFVYKDLHTENWWFEWNGVPVGYWPLELFKGLRQSAKVVAFGGDVYSPRMTMKPHTSTEMGSGQFAYAGEFACYIKPRVLDYFLQLQFPNDASTTVEFEDCCYNKYLHADTIDEEPVFYFGGPGRNLLCN